MNQTRACGLPQRVPQGESAPWLVVLEPHDAASHRDEPVVPRSFGQNSVITKLADLGEQRIWLDAEEVWWLPEGPTTRVGRTDHQKTNTQDGFLDSVEQETTGLRRWRPRIRVFHEMRLRGFPLLRSIGGLC